MEKSYLIKGAYEEEGSHEGRHCATGRYDFYNVYTPLRELEEIQVVKQCGD